jgi:PAS domain S-box-containing protein
MKATRVAVFAPAGIALALGTALLVGLQRARSSRQLVAQTHAVIESLDHTFARLVDAETGVRGYMIRGDTTFLEPYVGAAADVRAGIARLRTLTADRAAEQRRLDTLEALSAEKMALLDSGVRARRTEGLRALTQAASGPPSSPTSNRGKVVMGQARRLIADMETEERQLLNDRMSADEARTRFVLVLAGVGSLLAAIIALVINARLGAFAMRQAQQARELDGKNVELAQQGEQLEQQNEELLATNEDLARITDQLTELTSLLNEAERSTHLGSWHWDVSTNAVTWSDEMYRIYGLQPQSTPVSYESFLRHVHPGDRAWVDATVRDAYTTHAPFSFDHRIVRPDGVVRTLHAEGRVIVGPDGKPLRLVGSGQDVTERVAAAAEREQLLAEIAVANRAKMDFLTTMSHELRTPLTAIDGYAELLMLGIRGPVTGAQTADLARIRESGRHLLGIISDILNFAKLEAGQSSLNLTDMQLSRMLARVESLIAPQVQAKGIHYTQTLDNPMLLVHADEERLTQVVLNLVTNAVKFTDRGGSVAVVCEADEHMAKIYVRDNGRGIPADKLPLVFDPFVQIDAGFTLAGAFRGSGLGLAISRDLVRQMGGELTVESVVGVGSTFTFTVPCAVKSPTTLSSRTTTHSL